jgi:predicted proteasome-type protease
MLRRAKILYAETHLMEFVRAGARLVLETIGTLATLAGILQTWRAGARGKKERKLQALSELSDAVAATMKVVTAKRKRSSSNADLVNAGGKLQ